MSNSKITDIAIIGGGFYGCCVALLIKEYFDKVTIIEKESDLLQRASAINQARVHNGYHYPRNLVTAYRSFINFPRFVADFRHSIIDDFDKIYAIARKNSKVNANQFFNIYKKIGSPIKIAPGKYQKLFNKENIEEVFSVKEFAFDCVILKDTLKTCLEKAGIEVLYETEVEKVSQLNDNQVRLHIQDENYCIDAQMAFNCTYSQINKLLKNSGFKLLPMKHEMTEMALIELPDYIKNIGVTVMDGPFFSTMPYPSKKLHSLSHVRYTPHGSWVDMENFIDGHENLKKEALVSNYLHMQKDSQRYLPCLEDAQYKGSIYEIKTVLLQNEVDDGRPILFEKDYGIKNFSIIMGGKLDNIYDVLEMIGESKKALQLKKSPDWNFWVSKKSGAKQV